MNDSVFQLYLRDVTATAALTPAPVEQAEVIGQFGEDQRRNLVIGHLRNVVHIAFDYLGCGLPLGDLVNEGNLGLLRAAELFDPARNVRFCHYARPWIRVHMNRAVSYQAYPVSLPADYSWRRRQVASAEERLGSRLHREAADAEVAEECGLNQQAVRRLRSKPAPSFVPFDTPSRNEEGLTLEDVLPDEHQPAPDAVATYASDREFVESLLCSLTSAEQQVVRLRFGLEDGAPRTLEEVGNALGFPRQKAHRLETSALRKMRHYARFLEATAMAA